MKLRNIADIGKTPKNMKKYIKRRLEYSTDKTKSLFLISLFLARKDAKKRCIKITIK